MIDTYANICLKDFMQALLSKYTESDRVITLSIKKIAKRKNIIVWNDISIIELRNRLSSPEFRDKDIVLSSVIEDKLCDKEGIITLHQNHLPVISQKERAVTIALPQYTCPIVRHVGASKILCRDKPRRLINSKGRKLRNRRQSLNRDINRT